MTFSSVVFETLVVDVVRGTSDNLVDSVADDVLFGPIDDISEGPMDTIPVDFDIKAVVTMFAEGMLMPFVVVVLEGLMIAGVEVLTLVVTDGLFRVVLVWLSDVIGSSLCALEALCTGI
jgi:hypothetical protein